MLKAALSNRAEISGSLSALPIRAAISAALPS
jgi:hypothetical protein